jgi:hypothetical protein
VNLPVKNKEVCDFRFSFCDSSDEQGVVKQKGLYRTSLWSGQQSIFICRILWCRVLAREPGIVSEDFRGFASGSIQIPGRFLKVGNDWFRLHFSQFIIVL